MLPVSVVIPAYNPGEPLSNLVDALVQTDIYNIIVVNDGSTTESHAVFDHITQHTKVVVLTHAANIGKGAALKTGLNYVGFYFSDHIGVVTADADGQHTVDDILSIARSLIDRPDHLILGVREFKKEVPLRSRMGNRLTAKLYKLLTGQSVSDTQSGLRGIPLSLIPLLLKIRSRRYEFELDMLLVCKYHHVLLFEKKIETIYIENNKSSHFNPIWDSLKIYFELFRSILLSFVSAVIDNLVFFLCHVLGFGIFGSQCVARLISASFNYPMSKRMVFVSDQSVRSTLPKYILLAIVSGSISYGVINFLIFDFPINVMTAKIIAEIIIYLANFAIQRDFIFTKKM